MKPIFSRGPSLQLRLVIAVVVSIALIVADSQIDSFAQIRKYMDTAIRPFFYLANGPGNLLDNTSEIVVSRKQLQLENKTLRQELILKNSDMLLMGQLTQENKRLRELLGSPLRQDEYKMVTQVLSTDSDPYSNQIFIDKGSSSGVYEGQPVISDKGVVGQVIAVAQNTSRVLLICDASHAIPVQVLRNDVRVIAVGTGCMDDLLLEYLPLNSEVKVGDELVTSGLGGRFPEGYPVAVVSSVILDRQRANTIIHARSIVSMERLRYLLLLWPREQDGAPLPAKMVQKIANRRQIQAVTQDLLNAPPTDLAPQAVNTRDANNG